MIRTLIDLITFINSLSGFLVALLFWIIVTISFAKFIKRHAKLLYWIFGIMGVLTLLPILNLFGVKMMNIIFIPVLGDIFIEFTYATYFIHPILVIIMFMGAFSTKIPAVAKLMSIRKELSIIVGFAVIPHALKRILMTVPSAWNYFADHADLVAQGKVTSEWGQGISNAVFLLGVVMTIFFLVLWITSFGGVRKRMGQKKWKSVQRWSYGLYAMLFIQAVGIDAGSMVSYLDRQKLEPKTEAAAPASMQKPPQMPTAMMQGMRGGQGGEGRPSMQGGKPGMMSQGKPMSNNPHNFAGKFKFTDIEVSPVCKSSINILILVAVYGSYLFFRLRKARRDRMRRQS